MLSALDSYASSAGLGSGLLESLRSSTDVGSAEQSGRGEFRRESLRVLVTGCCGRIGQAVCDELLSSADITTLVGFDRSDRERCPVRFLKSSKFNYIQGNLDDYAVCFDATDNINAVVHLAAIPDDANAQVLLPTNVNGFVNILQSVQRRNKTQRCISRLVVASSGKLWAGYGPVTTPLQVHDAPAPRCLYSATKAFAEAAAQAFAEDFDTGGGCQTIALRFGWCPRTMDDLVAMKSCTDPGTGVDEFLSAADAGSCVLAALLEDFPDNFRFAPLFCQSLPPHGHNGRFDLKQTQTLLGGWAPKDRFPAGHESLCASYEPSAAYDLKPRRSYSVTSSVPSPMPAESSVRKRVGETEWALRVELAAAYRVFAMLGWTHLIHTHITVKVPTCSSDEDLFLINPYGLLWDEIDASSLVTVRANGGIVDNGSTAMPINPAGFKIHSAIHTSDRGQEGGDILWTMHTHTPECVAVASLGVGLIRGLSQYAMDLGGISYHDFEHATKPENTVCARLVQDLGPTHKICMLRNHGPITVGKTVSEAFFLMYQLVEACKVQVQVLSMSKGPSDFSVVPDEVVEETYSIVQANYTGKPFGELEWLAAKRRMEKSQGLGYRL